ncbi:MAG: mechanosensitive ion channel domain-containing protein [Pseudomonadota bacterium]
MDRLRALLEGITERTDIEWLAVIIAVAAVLTLAVVVYFVARLLAVRVIGAWVAASSTQKDDRLLSRGVLNRAAHLPPALFVYELLPNALTDYPIVANAVSAVALIYVIFSVALIIDTLLTATFAMLRDTEIASSMPLTSVLQVLKIALYFIASILTLSVLLGESPLHLLAGLGAMTAVLMLVFKDPILGFVAGIQLSSNRMVSVGDWIEMPKYGADGDVQEIALTTVKVKNFDNTVTTVPTQALINESFRNWRAMQESGGRRIKRSVLVDVASIRFLGEDDIERFAEIDMLADYIKEKRSALVEANKTVQRSAPTNQRRLTNVGTYRAYIEAYLRQHPQISQTLTLLVRQLAPTEQGLPIEIYAFSTDKNWANYESIQADIFDHILAAAGEFDLRIVQIPTGQDMRALRDGL